MKWLSCLLFAALCSAQISAPRIGFVRDRNGALRSVEGVAGSFILGDAIATGVLSASFKDRHGLAKTDNELLIFLDGQVRQRREAPGGAASFGFDAQGRPEWVRFANGECLIWDKEEPTSGVCPSAEPDATVEGDELVLRRNHIRLRVSGPVEAVEKISSDWLAVYTDTGILAIRTEDGRESVYLLPEREVEP